MFFSPIPPQRVLTDEPKHLTIAVSTHLPFFDNLQSEIQRGASSSFGRALPWHGRGEGFESPEVHYDIHAARK